jgi:hypothetical protein
MKKLLFVAVLLGVLAGCAANKNEKCREVGGERNEHEVCEKV